MKKMFFYILIMVFSSCKKSEKSTINNQLNCLDQKHKYFMHGCGTGCVMHYEMLNYKKTDSSYIIKFKGDMTIYEDIEDVFKAEFELFCNGKKSVKFLSVDDNENMYNLYASSANISFRQFGDKFCSCINKE